MRLVPIVVLVTPENAREIARMVNDAPDDVLAQIATACELNGWEPSMLVGGTILRQALDMNDPDLATEVVR